MVRHATRYGGGPVGLARARAATLTMLALPGSSYLYQGEELGLESVDVPPELRQDPAWFRTGVEWRDGCRVPIPWARRRSAPYGFGPGAEQPWLPQPADWADAHGRGADRQDADSTLAFYRKALTVRRTFATTAPATRSRSSTARTTVLAFRRGPVTVVLNAGNRAGRAAGGRGAGHQRPRSSTAAAAEHRRLAALTSDVRPAGQTSSARL